MLRCDSWMLICLMISGMIHLTCTCSELALHQALFKDYNKLLRPVKNQSSTTFLKSNTAIYSIVSVNEQEESIDLVVWTVLIWQDEYLQWNPTNFDNCTSLFIPASEIWQPDYIIINLLDSEPIISDNVLYVRIESNGLVFLDQTYYVTLRCDMDITAFPFDTQICSIIGSIWAYDSTQINLTLSDKRQNFNAVQMVIIAYAKRTQLSFDPSRSEA
uniref:Neurotransmitter-gated ion-channel ligand-binding domain-containing protein n=1 Tax=Plectus sambesii TaxID=2011161 RepID=A0A914WNV3_9BILA